MLDVLLSAIALIVVLLLLSMVVTAAAQFVQAVLRLRARSLLKGLTELLRTAPHGALRESPEAAARRLLRRGGMWTRVASDPGLSETLFEKWFTRLAGPQGRWLTREELASFLPAANHASGGHPQKPTPGSDCQRFQTWRDGVLKEFDGFGREVSARFARHMKVVSFILSCAVAFYFQVSTLELLARLTKDPALRARYAAAADRMLERAPPGGPTLLAGTKTAANALDALAKEHESDKEAIAKAKRDPATVDDAVNDLRTVLEQADAEKAKTAPPSDADKAAREAARARIVAEYREALEGDLQARWEEIRQARADLASIDLRPWAGGREYYWPKTSCGHQTRFDRLAGVLVTAILLSLGAPFWFERLREAAKLKDLLEPPGGRPGSPSGDGKAGDGKAGDGKKAPAAPANGADAPQGEGKDKAG